MRAKQINKTIIHSLTLMNVFLLAVHVFLFTFFTVMRVTLMSYVNVASVLLYAGSFWILRKGKITLYVDAAFLEISVHMFLAVVSMGWASGFQLYFIGSIAVVFYADYFSVRLGSHHVSGGILSVVSGVLYMFSLMVTRSWGSLYPVTEGTAFFCLILNSMVIFVFVTIFLIMLTRLATHYEEEMERQATHDKLTGMVNRHYLVEHLDGIYAAGNMESYWLAILDIDDFKGVNDRHGHLCGDFVLKTVAAIIKESCGERIVCRWGGEEFLIVGDSTERSGEDVGQEDVLLEEIRKKIERYDFVYNSETEINLTVTIGAARYCSGQTVDEWINVADSRLYHGKQIGKNKVIGSGRL